jgi:hypothetical protein
VVGGGVIVSERLEPGVTSARPDGEEGLLESGEHSVERAKDGYDDRLDDFDDDDVDDFDELDDLREPYTRGRFVREAGVAVGILAVGLPFVLLLAPPGTPQRNEGRVPQASVTDADAASSPAAQEALRYDSRPLVFVTADVGRLS